MADYSKDPPGIMIFDYKLVQELLRAVDEKLAGFVAWGIINRPWPDENEAEAFTEAIRERAKSQAEATIAISAYKAGTDGALRGLGRYRKSQADGEEAVRRRWGQKDGAS